MADCVYVCPSFKVCLQMFDVEGTDSTWLILHGENYLSLFLYKQDLVFPFIMGWLCCPCFLSTKLMVGRSLRNLLHFTLWKWPQLLLWTWLLPIIMGCLGVYLPTLLVWKGHGRKVMEEFALLNLHSRNNLSLSLYKHDDFSFLSCVGCLHLSHTSCPQRSWVKGHGGIYFTYFTYRKWPHSPFVSMMVVPYFHGLVVSLSAMFVV